MAPRWIVSQDGVHIHLVADNGVVLSGGETRYSTTANAEAAAALANRKLEEDAKAQSRRRLTILAPADLKPGTISPSGAVIETATLITNEKAGIAIVSLTFVGWTKAGPHEVISWPLGVGWTVDGRTAAE